jgi:hypothetical protein
VTVQCCGAPPHQFGMINTLGPRSHRFTGEPHYVDVSLIRLGVGTVREEDPPSILGSHPAHQSPSGALDLPRRTGRFNRARVPGIPLRCLQS